ncbi:MAG: L,D-transpeptidase [Rhizobiaceae bacterium]|nr:L,D-transpeptidase [Rhizobiaceae bacterium]MBL4696528.1 L,D-transpeptidase [Rhizobiaceae bacterium]MBL4732675.1 L,D-transpeptidase [Rhizobiaceae bacterium]
MVLRIAAIFALVSGIVISTNFVAVPDASAERVYDYTEMRWKNVDPNRRKYTRKAAPRKFNRRVVSIQTKEKPGTIIIHTDAKFLYYVTGQNKAIRYGVGVGREGFGWNGRVKIKRKVEWPSWTPPREMIIREAKVGHHLPARMKGGIDNPLGARALYLYKGNQDTMYRIHGTNQPWSIGLNLSSGCIRMLNKDVEHLYKQAKIGTNVIVVGPGENANKYFKSYTNPFLAFLGG